MSGTNPQGGAQMKTHLGHYEIVGELGRGGMGVVYKAFEPALNRFVAIKELSPSLAHDPDLVERFLREARSMAQLSDPHIIQIYFIGTDETTRQPFFAMEFVEGDSLSALLKRHGRFSVEDTLKIIHQAAQGLATAHDQGVIHRDIKPGNLMLTKRGQVKIADFGIALATRDLSRKLTSTGEFVGTPGYLSPEVCLAKNIDQRSDIFSLGIVMFEMLTGRSPFTDESPLGLMLEVVKAEIPDIRQLNGEVDPQTAAILSKMVAKEPADRFSSCHDLAAALQAHPLVAKGGPVRFAAITPAPNDGATVVGAPTPASAQVRKVTPPPVVRSADAPQSDESSPTLRRPVAEAPKAAAPVRPSVLEREAQRKTNKVPLAIAAALLLVVAGGAFALRGPIVDFVRGVGDGFAGHSEKAYEQGRVVGQASNPVGVSTAAPLGDAGKLGEVNPYALASSEADLGAQAATPYPESATTASTAIEIPSQPSVSGDTQSLATMGTDYGNVASAAASVAQTGAGETASAPAVQQAPVQVAVAEKPKVTPPPAVPRRVVVIGIGDSAIVGPARQRIEDELVKAGFDLADADALGVGDSSSLDSALRAVSRSAQVAIVVKSEPIGSTQLNYYGRSSELYSANLNVRAYRTSDKSPIGSGFRKKVEFTTLNADTQAVQAVKGSVGGLISTISEYKKRG